ncbi:MAG: precorrin-6A/cobalt-precorrin-6A reductase, partial [Alphaproteobacteria bacterium]
TDVNVIRYLRPAWEIQNNWIMCEDENQIKDKLSDFTGNVFFALGGKTVQHYSDLNCYLVARVVGDTQITNGECIIGKGAMDMHSEIKLFDKYNFDVVVCKNSGGKINYNKIEIATDRNIPIVMLSRPIDNSKVIIDTIDKVKDYL